jgi:hypothetical protein
VTPEPELHSTAQAIKTYSATAYEAFIEMREAITKAGPLPPHMCEIIRCSHYAALGTKGGFMVHGARALDLGATLDELRHGVLVTMGTNTIFGRVGEGLEWVDELERQRSAPDNK